MTWTALVLLVSGLGFALAVMTKRRSELRSMATAVQDRDNAKRHGLHRATLQHPVIDLSRCLGCGTCVAVCPEDGVLELVHGQAVVVRGSNCVGVSACERECPTGAVAVTLDPSPDRKDIPNLSAELEAEGSPGLFLAGEVTAQALIKTAVEHGTSVARSAAQRIQAGLVDVERLGDITNANTGGHSDQLDLLIVGAGPAGLACALEAKRLGLSFLVIDQEEQPGGTVAKYPRNKLVLTQPVELPLHGRLKRTSYSKEELIELWQGIAQREELPFLGSTSFLGLDAQQDGSYAVSSQVVTTPDSSGKRHKQATVQQHVARNVCLAIGRRGIPRKLGVAGEELPKVTYNLVDAASFQNRKILVVGGGDSAVEAAIGLAEQDGNDVTLAYRREELFRIRSKNQTRLQGSLEQGQLQVLFQTEVEQIADGSVVLTQKIEQGPGRFELPNDDVFVMAGGTAPIELLRNAGVNFDRDADSASSSAHQEQGTGLLPALAIGLVLSFATLMFLLWQGSYYLAPEIERPAHPQYNWLRPAKGLGLAFGIAGTALIVVNLLYLVRRMRLWSFEWGSLKGWMHSHVATGILAFLCACLHAGMAPRATPGGRSFWCLAVLLVTGAIGRYLYAYIPRAANGRELELDEVKGQLHELTSRWFEEGANSTRAFAKRVRQEVHELIATSQWSTSWIGRFRALFGAQTRLERKLRQLRRDARAEGLPAEEVQTVLSLARRAHRAAVTAAHYEDVRAVLSSWRYLHRWVAVLMVLLVVVHIVSALQYGSYFGGGS